jgi:hypothetical protein
MAADEKAMRLVARVISVVLGVSIVALAGVGEYLLRAGHFADLQPVLPDPFRYTLGALAILAFALAVAMKRTVTKGTEGFMLSLIKALIRNVHHRGGGTSYGFIVVPLALCESIGVMGFVVFYLSGGDRGLYYPFLMLALVGLLVVLPSRDYEDNLIRLDAEVEGDER